MKPYFSFMRRLKDNTVPLGLITVSYLILLIGSIIPLQAQTILPVRNFETWSGGIIKSTDPAGIAYHPPSRNLYISDSEINEIPEIFEGNNIFEISLSGDLVFREIASGNSEPTGITYNEFDGFFYVTNDDRESITRYAYNLNDPLETVTTTDDIPSALDPEGITSDPRTGFLYIVDGADGGDQVLVYNSALAFQYHFQIPGGTDAEGIAFNPLNNHLFLVSARLKKIMEYETGGTLVNEYDISGFMPPLKNPQGLTFGPTSDPTDEPENLSIYIADGIVDNNADPEERDGRIYEAFVLPHFPVDSDQYLLQNYPNPFNLSTTIKYILPEETQVRLVIYNAAGQRIKTLVDKYQPAGLKTVIWNGENNKGVKVASGIYICVLRSATFDQSRKILHIR
jgi:hypothetical protein